MNIPIIIPPPVRRTKKCKRCGQLYPKKESRCIHCRDLSESEVHQLKLTLEEQHESHQNLGKILMMIAFLIIVGMAVLVI